MSTNRLGGGKNLDRFWTGHLPTDKNTRVHLEEPEKKEVPDLEEVSDYPYARQSRYRGTFEFHFEDWKGRTQSKKGDYEYRTGSGLFIVDTKSDYPSPEEVIDELNEILPASITESLSVDRQSLWDFFDNANQYDQLVLIGPAGRFEYRVLRDVATTLRDEGIESPESLTRNEAESLFDDVDAAESVIPVLEDLEIPELIEGPEDLGIERDDYAIEKANVAFKFKEDLVGVSYTRGDLRIHEDASDEQEEYVIQLFERDVIYPSYGR